jgi:hypothetical protein
MQVRRHGRGTEMPHTQSRAARAIHWVETYCLYPNGPEKGRRVRLSPAQKDAVRKIYGDLDGFAEVSSISGPLAAYLALLHVCGPEALRRGPRAPFRTDIFTLWNATGPDLREVLRLEGTHIVCPELGTRYPVAA